MHVRCVVALTAPPASPRPCIFSTANPPTSQSLRLAFSSPSNELVLILQFGRLVGGTSGASSGFLASVWGASCGILGASWEPLGLGARGDREGLLGASCGLLGSLEGVLEPLEGLSGSTSRPGNVCQAKKIEKAKLIDVINL